MFTPSIGIDQNGEGKFKDRYWGRVPMYLHRIPETIGKPNEEIVVCNPEYIELVLAFLDGNIDQKNLSIELYLDIITTVNLIPDYGETPMPEYDAFFKCAGFDPSISTVNYYEVIDTQFNGAFFWTADSEIFGVQSE